MKLIKQKKNKQLKINVTESQYQKIHLVSYYSGRTMGEILRTVIDKFEVKQLKRLFVQGENEAIIEGLSMKGSRQSPQGGGE